MKAVENNDALFYRYWKSVMDWYAGEPSVWRIFRHLRWRRRRPRI